MNQRSVVNWDYLMMVLGLEEDKSLRSSHFLAEANAELKAAAILVGRVLHLELMAYHAPKVDIQNDKT